MRNTFPSATLSIVVLSTIIQVLNIIGEPTSFWLYTNFNITNWDNLYNQPWRMITSSFLHNNFFHYLGNISTLLLLGWRLERKLGPLNLIGAFFGGMLTAYVIWVTTQHGWLVGISGGVCGIFGLSLIANRQEPWWKTVVADPIHISYLVFLAVPFLPFFEAWVGFRVANLVHLIGIIYGGIFGLALLFAPKNSQWHTAVFILPLILTILQSFTPWQYEWKLVHEPPILVSEHADCQVQTIEEEIPSVINFVNSSDQPVAGYLLSFEGIPMFSFILPPGEETGFFSFVTHAWCLVDVHSREARQLAVVTTEPEQTFIYP